MSIVWEAPLTSAVPANQIAGTVLLNNNANTPDANQWVSICQIIGQSTNSFGCRIICTDTFHVETNSYGEYRFFAPPNTTYGISANLSTPFGVTSHSNSITSGSAGGTTFDNFSLYTSRVSGQLTNSATGEPLPGAKVTFTSSNDTSFSVTTNINGVYSENFTDNGTYTVTASDSGYFSASTTVILSDSTITENFALTPAGTVNFDESGLHGNTWSVTLDNQYEQSSSSHISFQIAYGSYSYTIGSVTGYTSSPVSGNVRSDFTGTTKNITFTPTSYYTLTFNGLRLPSGYTWSVTIGGTTNSASTGSSISFSEADGYFTYSPSSLLVPTGTPGYYQDYHAPGGTAHVSGASQVIDISYSYTLMHFCVNSSTEIMLANGTYKQAQYIATGTAIMSYNITTGSLQQEIVQQAISVNETSQYTINGNLQVSGDQPILTAYGWISASSLHKGEAIFDPIDGEYLDVASIHHSYGVYTMYDFFLYSNNDFIAYSYLLQGVRN